MKVPIQSILAMMLAGWLVIQGALWASAAPSVQNVPPDVETPQISIAARALYLPLIATSKQATTPTVTPTPTPTVTPTVTPTATSVPTVPPTPPAAGRSSVFVETAWKTNSAALKVDAQGGLHIAYDYYEPNNGEAPNQAIYAYCAGQCEQPTSWTRVALGDAVDEVQLALTRAGQPRLLIRTTSTIYTAMSPGRDYYYAACDANCTNAQQWRVTYLLSSHGTSHLFDDGTPQRSFALDGQDRPRFLYMDRNYFYAEPDHYGTFYVYCDADCISHTEEKPTWFQTRLTDAVGYQYEWLDYPALTFTSQGGPRVFGYLTPIQADQPTGLYYWACDTNCEEGEQWERLFLIDRGQGVDASWDIVLDSHDRPRLAFYKGEDPKAGEHLYYLWCDSNCLASSEHWNYNDPGITTTNGKHPDLELDSQDRPRLAYVSYTDGGLGYAWCNANCETDAPAWQSQTVESRAFLQEVWPVAYPPGCDAGLWDGLTPVLALDATDNPRVLYDAAYHARCLYDDNPGDTKPPVYDFHLITRAVRGSFFPQP